MLQANKYREFNIQQIFLLTIGSLICIEFSGYFPSGTQYLFFTILFYYILKRDKSAFILIAFILSHYSYGFEKGGFWNHIIFLVLIYYYIQNPRHLRKLTGNRLSNFLLTILIIFSISGLIINGYLTYHQNIIYGFISFFSYILMFIFASQIDFSQRILKLVIQTLSIGIVLMFLTGLNQRLSIITMEQSYLLGFNPFNYNKPYIESLSTLFNSELFGEYSMLLIGFFSPLFLSNKLYNSGKFNRVSIALIIIICSINLILARTRSAIILSVLLIPLITVISLRFYRIYLNNYIFYILTVILSSLIIIILGSYIGFSKSLERFDDVNISKMTVSGVISGEDINREGRIAFGLYRLSSKNWFLGNGWNTSDINIINLSGHNVTINQMSKDTHDTGTFHSLYLTLPIYYGWFGAIAFILLFLNIIIQIWHIIFRRKTVMNFNPSIYISFFLFWVLFLIDEYKIEMNRSPNYQMMIWILLGLSFALVNKANKLSAKNNENTYN